MINVNRMHLISISSIIAKGLNTSVNTVFQIDIFNECLNISKNLFSVTQVRFVLYPLVLKVMIQRVYTDPRSVLTGQLGRVFSVIQLSERSCSDSDI